MKKITCLRNWWLPVLGAWAVLFAGSCSKDEAVEPDMSPETRAVPTFSISCRPAGKGDGAIYLSLKETYRFGANANVHEDFGVGIPPCTISVHAGNGGDGGFEIQADVPDSSLLMDAHVFVKFTSPGYYHVTAQAEWGGALYEKTRTYCVVSRATGMNLPESVELGVPFDFSFSFADPRYPDPTLYVNEHLFDDPQYTLLDSDEQGHYRMRIDQPGKYVVATGLGGKFSATSNIHVYFRPEKVTAASTAVPIGSQTVYENVLYLRNAGNLSYTSLPYRTYLKYSNNDPYLIPEEKEMKLAAGASGVIQLPLTHTRMEGVQYNWRSDIKIPIYNYYWTLTIPEDHVQWFCVVDPDDYGGTIDPVLPGGGLQKN